MMLPPRKAAHVEIFSSVLCMEAAVQCRASQFHEVACEESNFWAVTGLDKTMKDMRIEPNNGRGVCLAVCFGRGTSTSVCDEETYICLSDAGCPTPSRKFVGWPFAAHFSVGIKSCTCSLKSIKSPTFSLILKFLLNLPGGRGTFQSRITWVILGSSSGKGVFRCLELLLQRGTARWRVPGTFQQ